MKKAARDLSKNPSTATTPVNYRDANTVYRSLSAAPAPLEVGRNTAVGEKLFGGKLIGPQSKNQGEVVWSETKLVKPACDNSQPYPIPLIVANAPANALFVESNPVSKVVNAVHDLFQQHLVDASYNSSKFKWKCACYNGEIETRFVSCLFSVPDKPNFFVLDFQRRAGDPFHFQSIYKAINFRLLKSGFVVCNDGKSDARTNAEEPLFRTFKPMTLPSDFFDTDVSKEVCDMEPLLRMCTSPYIDVQREGLSALASQIESNQVARNSIISFASKLMEILSLSRDVQVRRLATSAISKLALEEEGKRLIADKGGVKVLVNIVINQTETMETRRHAGNALLQMTSLDSQTIVSFGSVGQTSDGRLDDILHQLQSKH
jgi:hypothetical protein